MNQDQFTAMLRDKGLKVTKQRTLVLGTMATRPEEHLTAEEIYNLTKENCPEIGLATIYRTIQVLLDMHIIHKVNLDDKMARYELPLQSEENHHHHHHALCMECGNVHSFKNDLLDNLEQAVYDTMGFYVINHEVKLYGLCKECYKKKKEGPENKKIKNKITEV